MKDETVEEREEREKGIFFGQLGSFGTTLSFSGSTITAMHMLSLGVPVKDVITFTERQCLINELSEEHQEALIVLQNTFKSDLFAGKCSFDQRRINESRNENEQEKNHCQFKWLRGGTRTGRHEC